ncbi:MAG TPA: aminodeoxychorismate/anthranilate synthase component II [Candidatus Sumerlaeota bacterium]|nr:aminodeoxychorismate/anthranilate synthase component II [Candidatus Sumerlaeota bacterium]
MILVIDNYDSFTYNLVQYLGELGADLQVVRNDKFRIEQIAVWKPERIVISPGPCTPKEAGLSCDVIRACGERIPILGVCLGHQCIGHVYGGEVGRAREVMHGKTSMIHHEGCGIFSGLPEPFEATRYHSLIVRRENLPECLQITAWTDDGIIMGLRHKAFPVFGVQFHPESILTRDGKMLLKNFLEMPAAMY